ncbi:hypothetical protein HKBW3S06_01479 [Candidatus Hakubella thermalkaliphila]|uniref:Uncharacterized protein n=1 Tax=Candidatus Hakubella thermalkaliphila TaxID=2754717 RepID=A0A6V8NPJ4_9ACTN|nr:hypothetical protein [Candidatus Hakubella thermalkaliphila]GFP22252.1 hypothetical protein HKBW3S06_01479 [Candidatus Hakubella thermalkaliphila]
MIIAKITEELQADRVVNRNVASPCLILSKCQFLSTLSYPGISERLASKCFLNKEGIPLKFGEDVLAIQALVQEVSYVPRGYRIGERESPCTKTYFSTIVYFSKRVVLVGFLARTSLGTFTTGASHE